MPVAHIISLEITLCRTLVWTQLATPRKSLVHLGQNFCGPFQSIVVSSLVLFSNVSFEDLLKIYLSHKKRSFSSAASPEQLVL